MSLERRRVVIMAGGTGGHVMPALAVAQDLRARGVEVLWIGTRAGIEAKIIPPLFEIAYIDIQKLRSSGKMPWLFAPWNILKAVCHSWRLLRRYRPQVVLSMGGYVAGPGGVAARILGIPLVLHEQNAIPGLTNRLLSLVATKILVGFPSAFREKKQRVVTGNPVRPEILALAPHSLRKPKGPLTLNILIIGGSQGASALNTMIPQALDPKLASKLDLIPVIWHQTGSKEVGTTQTAYREIGIEATVSDFIEDMAQAYAWADMVICRSGALTVSEIAVVGIASIFIPFPYAVDDHQRLNAYYLSETGGAMVMLQSELTPESLRQRINRLCDPKQREAMARVCQSLAKPEATQLVAQACLEVSVSE